MASDARAVPLPNPEEATLRRDVAIPFEEFFELEHSRLYRALAIMTGDRSEAEEVMQDAFLKVWERWDRVSAMDEPVGFLYRTAMNLYRKRLRRAAVAVRKVARVASQDDGFDTVETRDEAMRLLRTLTSREREAIVLTAYLGYSTEEAGRFLGIKANTVRVLTMRARDSLRQTVENRP